MGKLLNIKCWHANKIMLFLNKWCTKKIKYYHIIWVFFYFVLTSDQICIAQPVSNNNAFD